MMSDREIMSASLLLEQISSVQGGAVIKLPVVVNFDRTTFEEYASLLRVLLLAKSPKAVILYKWPESRVIDEKSLSAILEMLIDARIETIILDVRNLSSSHLEDLYQKTKRVMSEMTARPSLIADTMHHAYFWALRFMKLKNLPIPVMLPLQACPPRPDSVPPVSVTSNSIFSVEATPNLSASAHAGSLNEGQVVYFDDSPPPSFADDDLQPPADIMIEKPKEAPASSWLPSCSVM